ncbi:DoxX family protein [Kaistella yonginensis]|uniref:DoxX family protein n=1 Tax=Kaistella yonginensis TaxID=658267 RepID=UPI0025B413DA|nr:DoxX family protein [Kaistella yonginensis]MDN3606936.1 DoxX family protein [Kaistella yonginensis]
MNYFSSTKDHPAVNNIIMLLVRIFVGVAMIILHGLPKLQKFMAGGEIQFYNFLGLGSNTTLILAILVELICAFLIMIGLFTRAASLLLILVMAVAAIAVHAADPFTIKESSLLYLSLFALIFSFGPRKFSIDNMIAKRRESRW